MDDVFDEDIDTELQGNDWKCMKRNLLKLGFREGAGAEQDTDLQIGFNAGFTHEVHPAFQLAKLRGTLSALLGYQLIKKDSVVPNEIVSHLQGMLERVSTLEQNQKLAIKPNVAKNDPQQTDENESDTKQCESQIGSVQENCSGDKSSCLCKETKNETQIDENNHKDTASCTQTYSLLHTYQQDIVKLKTDLFALLQKYDLKFMDES